MSHYIPLIAEMMSQFGGNKISSEIGYAFDIWPDDYYPFIDWRFPRSLSLESVKRVMDYQHSNGKVYFNTLSIERDIASKLATDLYMKLDQTMYFGLWKNVMQADNLGNYDVLIDDFDSDLFAEYKEVTMKVFQFNDDRVLRLNLELSKKYKIPFKIVLIKDSGKSIATGGVCLVKNIGWLFSGCVLSDYQGKGLWKLLMNERMKLTKSLGADMWFIQTQVELIKEKAETIIGFDTFIKE